MAFGTSSRTARSKIEYWSGSAWVALESTAGTSRLLNMTIEDDINTARMASFTLFNPRQSSSNIFETGDLDTVLKNKMKIRITDQTTFTILFLGQVEKITPEHTLRGYTVSVVAYDGLFELANNILKGDFLNDSDRTNKPAKLKNDFISEDIAELIQFGSFNSTTKNIETDNTTDSDSTKAYRFQQSLGKTHTRDKDFGKSGKAYLNAINRLAELEAGVPSTASGRITGGLRPYNFYLDTNFKTTATNTEGLGNFFNYYPAGCMPGAAQTGTSYTLSDPGKDGLTLTFGTGDSAGESGQTLKTLPTFSFEDLARERITHVNVHFLDPISGETKDLEMEVFNYASIVNGGALEDLYEPSGSGTGGTETSKVPEQVNPVKDSGGNTVGFIQYISNASGAGFALLSGTTGTSGSIRHSVAAGEQLFITNEGGSSVGNFTLTSTTDTNGNDIFRPQEAFKQKRILSYSLNMGDVGGFRRAVAAVFESRDARRVRANFTIASGYPYHFVEGQVNSVAGDKITDSTITNSHSTSTDGFSSQNHTSFAHAGVRTGMVLHKLTGEGGVLDEFGYISKTEDNSLTATLTNSATFSTNDYYRVYVPLRAGHAVRIKNLAINSSTFDHVVTKITYEEGEGGFNTYIETVGDISGSKASKAGARLTSPGAGLYNSDYDDETFSETPVGKKIPHFSGTFEPGNVSDNNLQTAVQHSAGTLRLDDTEYTIAAGDSEDSTHGINGAMADDTDYVIYFEPDSSETKFKFKTAADYKALGNTDAGGSGNPDVLSSSKLRIQIGTARKNPNSGGEAGFELGANITAGTDYKFLGDAIAANAIKANNILNIGSDATSGVRFKFATPDDAPSGAGTHFFRGYTSNSNADNTGYWFNFDAHSQSIELTDGATSPTTRVVVDNGGVTVKGGGQSAAFFTLNDGSTDRIRMFANSSNPYFQIYSTTSDATIQVGGLGTTALVPHSVGTLGSSSKEWTTIHGGDSIQPDGGTVAVSGSVTATGSFTAAGRHLLSSTATNVTDSFGIFRFTDDGSGSGIDSLAFTSLQQNATPNASTANSAFWVMTTDVSNNRLHFEPIVDFSGSLNNAHIGFNNRLAGVNSFNHFGSTSATASGPAFNFAGDSDTGMFQVSADRLGFATGGTQRTTIDSNGTTLNEISSGVEAFNIFVTAAGLIKFVSSSERYKKDIVSLTTPSEKIYDLEPVNFTWKETGEKDFGLIAEKVHELIPELAVLKDGRPESVKYSMLSVLLLNEVQKLKKEIEQLKENN